MKKHDHSTLVIIVCLIVLTAEIGLTGFTVNAEGSVSDDVPSEITVQEEIVSEDTVSENSVTETPPGNSITVGVNGQYPTLEAAFRAIAGFSGVFVFDIGENHTEAKEVKLPKGDFSITITGGVLNLKAPTVTVNCDLVLDCTLSSVKKKKPTLKVAAGKDLAVTKEQNGLNALSGKKDSKLIIESNVTAESIKGFESVDIVEASLIINKTAGSIGTLSGNFVAGTKSTISDIRTATLYVCSANVSKTTIGGISGELSVYYTDCEKIYSGTQIFQYSGSQSIDGKVVILNTDVNDNILSAYQHGKVVKAEYSEALELLSWEGGDKDKREGDWKEKAQYPSLEAALAAMTGGNIYRLEVNTDIITEKIAIPAGIEELDIVGEGEQRTIDCGKTKTLKASCNITLRNLRLVSRGKSVKLNSGRFWIDMEQVELGSVNTANWLRLDGDCIVNGNISVHGIYAVKDAELRFQKLAVKKGGIRDFSKPVTLAVMDKNGNHVSYSAGDQVKAVSKFAGYFDETLLFISEQNCAGVKLQQKGSKLYIIK